MENANESDLYKKTENKKSIYFKERQKKINKYNIITRNKKDDISKEKRLNTLRNSNLNNNGEINNQKINSSAKLS